MKYKCLYQASTGPAELWWPWRLVTALHTKWYHGRHLDKFGISKGAGCWVVLLPPIQRLEMALFLHYKYSRSWRCIFTRIMAWFLCLVSGPRAHRPFGDFPGSPDGHSDGVPQPHGTILWWIPDNLSIIEAQCAIGGYLNSGFYDLLAA